MMTMSGTRSLCGVSTTKLSVVKLTLLDHHNVSQLPVWHRGLSCSGVHPMGRRDKMYGSEPGHGEKNEVRKERWWRKKNPPLRGGDWRELRGLEHDSLPKGIFARRPDWRRLDGEPGALTVAQEHNKEAELRLIEDIYEAAQVTLKAKEFESKKSQEG